MSQPSEPSSHPAPGQYAGPAYPPGPTAYPGPPPAHGFRPAHGLAIASAVLVALVTAMELLEAALAPAASEAFREAAARGFAPAEVMTGYDLVGVPLGAFAVAAWVVTALWLMQVRSNAKALNPSSPHARSTVWVWIGWFVPVVALWFPFQIVRDARRATVPESRSGGGIVGWWWAFWLLYAVTSRSPGPATSTDPATNLDTMVSLEVFGAAFAVGACVLWVLIVRQVTQDQRAVAVAQPGV